MMPGSRREWIFALLALAGLILPWTHNIAYMQAHPGAFSPLAFAMEAASTPAGASISWDITAACIAFLVWMPIEARRLGMKGWGWYFPLTLLVAFGCAMPAFLWHRERHLRKSKPW